MKAKERKILHGFYAITPECDERELLLARAEQVLSAGCSLLQYRDKTHDVPERLARAHALRELTNRYQARLIINDSVLLCLRVGADGVHCGRDDGSLLLARRLLGSGRILGASCYASLSAAVRAQGLGADYVAFGAVAPSPTKPNAVPVPLAHLFLAKKTLNVPVCAIGGINTHNAAAVLESGVDMLAVVSDLYRAADGESDAAAAEVAEKVRFFQNLFTSKE